MNYKIYNTVIRDVHLIYLSNYVIEVEFYPVKYWVLSAKWFKDKNVACLYLPMLDISIYSNKK